MTYPIYKSEEYTITAQFEVYHPALLFSYTSTKERLKMIDSLLKGKDYELPNPGTNSEQQKIKREEMSRIKIK